MSHTAKAFENGKALIAFLTAGVPSIEDTIDFASEAEKAGATMLEIGVPFSDPVADGPVIMEADVKAIQNHIHLPEVMEMVKKLRVKTSIPIVLFTYFNPIFNYPVETFFKEAKEIGIDGVVIPDLPYEEESEIRPLADTYGIDIIRTIVPTSEERIRELAKDATGFIYAIPPVGVCDLREDILENLQRIVRVAGEITDIPIVSGFDIATPEQAGILAKLSDGIIAGSGVVDLINKNGKVAGPFIAEFIAGLKAGMEE